MIIYVIKEIQPILRHFKKFDLGGGLNTQAEIINFFNNFFINLIIQKVKIS